jgi:hypothetical protein
MHFERRDGGPACGDRQGVLTQLSNSAAKRTRSWDRRFLPPVDGNDASTGASLRTSAPNTTHRPRPVTTFAAGSDNGARSPHQSKSIALGQVERIARLPAEATIGIDDRQPCTRVRHQSAQKEIRIRIKARLLGEVYVLHLPGKIDKPGRFRVQVRSAKARFPNARKTQETRRPTMFSRALEDVESIRFFLAATVTGTLQS